MRGRRETLRASVALLLAGLTAALAVPGSGGANPPVASLRVRAATLADKTHQALLDLYSLDARLAHARGRIAALQARAASVRGELADVERERSIAQDAWRTSVTALGGHLRKLYENAQPDELAVLLGASSVDDALTRLDELERAASLNRETILETRRARTQLTRLQLRLERRARELDSLVAAAKQTEAELIRTRADRASYIASLARRRAFTGRKIAQLQAQAQASAASAPTVAVPPAAVGPVGTPTRDAPAAATGAVVTMTVTATGYSLTGHTATGLPVGWGVVSVDPSLIPLGTRLTIPGYGEGFAADTGGGVQGSMIDLWFPTPAQALAWGRRTVTITLH